MNKFNYVERMILFPLIIIIVILSLALAINASFIQSENERIFSAVYQNQVLTKAKSLGYELALEGVGGAMDFDAENIKTELDSISSIERIEFGYYYCTICNETFYFKRGLGKTSSYEITIYFDKSARPVTDPPKDPLGILVVGFESSPEMDRLTTSAQTQLVFLFASFAFILWITRFSLKKAVTKPVANMTESVESMVAQAQEKWKGESFDIQFEFIDDDNELLTPLAKSIERLQEQHKLMNIEQVATQKNLQKELKKSQEEREKQSQLIVSLSHDINQPIRTLSMALKSSQHWFLEDEDYKRRGDLFRLYVYIHSLSQKAKNILDNALFLTTDRITANPSASKKQIQELTIYDLLCSTESIALFPFESQTKQISFEVDFNNLEDYQVRINKNKFERVVTNLCSNAIAYTPKGGKVTLKVQYVSAKDNEICIVVEDDGQGMDQDMLKKLNDSGRDNYKNPNSETSLGFGIFNCHRFLKEEGGKLTFFSEKSLGTKAVACFGAIILGEQKLKRSKKAVYFGQDFNRVRPLLERYYDVDLFKGLTPEDAESECVFLHDAYENVNGFMKLSYAGVSKEHVAAALKSAKRHKAKIVALQTEFKESLVEKKASIEEVKSLPEVYLKDLKGVQDETRVSLRDEEKAYFTNKKFIIIDDAHEFAQMLQGQIIDAVFPTPIDVEVVYSEAEAVDYLSDIYKKGQVIDYAFVDRMLGESHGEDVVKRIREFAADARLTAPFCTGMSAAEHKTNGASEFDQFYIKEPDSVYSALKEIYIQEK